LVIEKCPPLDVFIESYEEPPEALILDIDDTDDRTYGHQQLSLFNAYHGDYCYLPIHIYGGQSGQLITTVLRPGEENCRKSGTPSLKQDIRNIHGKSYLSKTQEELQEKVYLYEKKSSVLCRKHNSQYSFKIKSTHVSSFMQKT